VQEGASPSVSSVSHLIHGVIFAIGEMLDMNKITDIFIALGAVLLVVVVVAFVI
jgi:beta-lactamase regulating signal transducer with metallopeptidase domain